jgi:hypothetical protein
MRDSKESRRSLGEVGGEVENMPQDKTGSHIPVVQAPEEQPMLDMNFESTAEKDDGNLLLDELMEVVVPLDSC